MKKKLKFILVIVFVISILLILLLAFSKASSPKTTSTELYNDIPKEMSEEEEYYGITGDLHLSSDLDNWFYHVSNPKVGNYVLGRQSGKSYVNNFKTIEYRTSGSGSLQIENKFYGANGQVFNMEQSGLCATSANELVAYKVSVGSAEYVMVNNKPQKSYQWVSCPKINKTGSNVAYLGKVNDVNGIGDYVLIMNGAEVFNFSGDDLGKDYDWPIFSENGNKIFFASAQKNYSPNGKFSNWETWVYIYDLLKGSITYDKNFQGNLWPESTIDISPDGSYFSFQISEGEVRKHYIVKESNAQTTVLSDINQQPNEVLVFTSSNDLLYGDVDGNIKKLDLDNNTKSTITKLESGYSLEQIKVSNNDKTTVIVLSKGIGIGPTRAFKVVSLEGEKITGNSSYTLSNDFFGGYNAGVSNVTFSPDGNHYYFFVRATKSDNKQKDFDYIVVLDGKGIKYSNIVSNPVFSPDNRYVYFAYRSGNKIIRVKQDLVSKD